MAHEITFTQKPASIFPDSDEAVLVYVIGWMAVVFGINSASIVNRKE